MGPVPQREVGKRMSRRTGHEFRAPPRHPVAVWLVLGGAFLGSAGANLFLGVIGPQPWPFVVATALTGVALWCVLMAWRERGCR
jgi:protein-S-isoprenylcysteine O-methyltransferase Ste14